MNKPSLWCRAREATHRVDHDVPAVDPRVLAGVDDLLALLRREVREVEAGSRDKVLWLSDIHPESGEIV